MHNKIITPIWITFISVLTQGEFIIPISRECIHVINAFRVCPNALCETKTNYLKFVLRVIARQMKIKWDVIYASLCGFFWFGAKKKIFNLISVWMKKNEYENLFMQFSPYKSLLIVRIFIFLTLLLCRVYNLLFLHHLFFA